MTKVVAQQGGPSGREGLLSPGFVRMMLVARVLLHGMRDGRAKPRQITMNSKTKLAVGILTALAMLALTFALPRGGGIRDAQLVQFPVTFALWAIFVLLFVKLK